jgi:hypothetical protein
LSGWSQLLSRTILGLAVLEEAGQPVPEWLLGGGTALMLFANHRLSKDVDVFIDDPQHLSVLSPDVTDVWACTTWDKAAHYLKLKYPEGEIDFIVAAAISDLPPEAKHVDLTHTPLGKSVGIRLDSPVETALKKIHYRATMLKPRDIFDIAVVDTIDHDRLVANLHAVADRRDDLLRRLTAVRPDFVESEIAELDIQAGWENEKANCLDIVRSIAKLIPGPAPAPRQA